MFLEPRILAQIFANFFAWFGQRNILSLRLIGG